MSYISPVPGQISSVGADVGAGNIGERIFSQVTEASRIVFTPTSALATYNITSLTITSGIWSITGWGAVGTVTTDDVIISNGYQISTSLSGWVATKTVGGHNSLFSGLSGYYTSSYVPNTIFNVSTATATQTVYLNTQVRYFVFTAQASRFGWLMAERIA